MHAELCNLNYSVQSLYGFLHISCSDWAYYFWSGDWTLFCRLKRFQVWWSDPTLCHMKKHNTLKSFNLFNLIIYITSFVKYTWQILCIFIRASRSGGRVAWGQLNIIQNMIYSFFLSIHRNDHAALIDILAVPPGKFGAIHRYMTVGVMTYVNRWHPAECLSWMYFH